jgi:glutamate transport system permease protein
MTAPVLADTLGPRGRRRVLIASLVASLVLAAVFALAVKRFADNGQLAEDKWRPLTQWAVIKFYLGGAANTLRAAAVSMFFALSIGALAALARLAKTPPLRWVATLYVEFFRGLPLFVLIVFTWLGFPKLHLRLDSFWYLVIALSVYNSSILAEIFRAGILSLDRGQSEAAYAIGLSYWQAMGLVVIPHAVRRMVPAIVSQLVIVLKDTSLGVFVFYEELLRRARLSAEYFRNPVHAIALVALFYIAINLVLGTVARRLEARQRHRYRAEPIAVRGVEDLAAHGI